MDGEIQLLYSGEGDKVSILSSYIVERGDKVSTELLYSGEGGQG